MLCRVILGLLKKGSSEHLDGQESVNTEENGKIGTSAQPREDVGWKNQRWNLNQEGWISICSKGQE